MPKRPLLLLATTLCMPCCALAADNPTWKQAQAATRIHGSTYYVGTVGLSSILIHGDKGSILLDGTLAESAPLVEANIRALGYRLDEVKLILNSHAHFDHAGGIATLQKDTGATVVASPSGAQGLRLGHAVDDDPQAGYAKDSLWPAVGTVREVADGETLRLGNLAVTAHFTPGHTPGSTTWTWRSCEGAACVDIVYADSLNAISAPGFHYLADATHGDLTASFRQSIRTVASLPCDILITVHPELSGIGEKLQQAASPATVNPFIDRGACRDYAARAGTLLDDRIASERAAASK